MSEEGLQAEIRRLVKENDRLRLDLRAERGEGLADELRVTRWGTDQVDPATFHVRLSVDTIEAERGGERYLDMMLGWARRAVLEELERRRALKNPPRGPERA